MAEPRRSSAERPPSQTTPAKHNYGNTHDEGATPHARYRCSGARLPLSPLSIIFFIFFKYPPVSSLMLLPTPCQSVCFVKGKNSRGNVIIIRPASILSSLANDFPSSLNHQNRADLLNEYPKVVAAWRSPVLNHFYNTSGVGWGYPNTKRVTISEPSRLYLAALPNDQPL